MKKLGKPFRTPDGPKKFSVYVKNDKGNTVKVNFGDPEMEIKRDDPKRRKAFRDRHGCDEPGPRWKPKYWSCKLWSGKPVGKIIKGESEAKTVEPEWVADEEVWNRAKKAAKKGDAESPWALTTYLYKRMGGKIEPKEAATGKAAQPGIRVPFWFYGTEAFVKLHGKRGEASGDKAELPPKATGQADVDAKVQKLLVDTPDLPANALVQALKSQGIELVDTTAEADSATSHGELQRESTGGIAVRATFIESSYRDDGIGPTRFKVALIQEGLGNLKDAFYYTRAALESGIQAFEGKKCFADHPSRSEESDRPERSVRDIVGHFENCRLEEREDGGAILCAELVMLPTPANQWARSLVTHALEYSKRYSGQEFIGLSINASGDARAMPLEQFVKEGDIPSEAKPKLFDALERGIETVRVVDSIRDAVSTDLVTEPGARGKVLELLETERDETMKKKVTGEKVLEAEKEMKAEEMKAEEMKAEEMKAEAEDGEEDHEDVEKDKALILSMIKKHMGKDGEDLDEEAAAAACEAHEAYCEMGQESEEAAKHAAEAMKLAKHMAKKAEAAAKESDAEKGEDEEKVEEAKATESEVKLAARIAFLERKVKTYELAETLDRKLAESKLGRAETDKIRTLIGTPKSESQIEHTIKVFKEAFGMASGSESRPSFASLFVTGTEKQADDVHGAKVNFAECLKF